MTSWHFGGPRWGESPLAEDHHTFPGLQGRGLGGWDAEQAQGLGEEVQTFLGEVHLKF